MKAAEVKKLTDAELLEKLGELDKELLNLRLQAKTGQIENTARIREARKTVARIKTEQTARSK
ncbi:30S ribosomal protein S17 [Lentisphaera araneosa HTCC2155]|jgi:large subunit ribosomal protein L29|uniref:Large ribosomal subunit protein uL29 n=1 Tax=Lentisphaera araneosa HTCC2155 TaxID=313628 RepID=A6DRB8_9BACT|nr:50S ribosomal protein L29 [Lentisphaera araneosa]EDM25865.1 30S ribosomal protein S17 [Lentisphaera araneosa HTCC2155]